MLKYKKLILLINLYCFTHLSNAATPILTTIILSKNTPTAWSHFWVDYQKGYPAQYQVHVSPDNDSQMGTVIFILPSNQNTNFVVSYNADYITTDFCAINIRINADNTSTIMATSINADVPFTCSIQHSITEPDKLIIQPKDANTR